MCSDWRSMLPIPDEILRPFETIMAQKAVPLALRPDYLKWLKYYLDFRIKYPPPNSKSDHVRLFVEKLRSKGQTKAQVYQAAHALSLFFSLQSRNKTGCGRVLRCGVVRNAPASGVRTTRANAAAAKR